MRCCGHQELKCNVGLIALRLGWRNPRILICTIFLFHKFQCKNSLSVICSFVYILPKQQITWQKTNTVCFRYLIVFWLWFKIYDTVIGRGLCASSLSPSLKLHCIAMTTIFTQNDHFFQTWPFWLKAEQINLFQSIWSDLKKWSFWVKIAVIAMQCNAISMKVTSLMRIDSQYVVNPSMCICGSF